MGLALLCLAACSNNTMTDTELPAPGTMVVRSVEAIAGQGDGGLLPNGDFSEWYGGLNFPTGFVAPANEAVSILVRDPKYGHLGTTGYTARQGWQASDAAEAPQDRFGTTLSLEGNRDYVLTVVAATTPMMAASIDAYSIDEDGGTRILASRVVEVAGESPTQYTGRFRTDETGRVLLCSRASADATVPGAVAWSSWKLEFARSAPAVEESIDFRGAWIRNSLDHVREQTALYGGETSWANALPPLHARLGETFQEVSRTPGDTFVGRDQYIFQKSELQYAQGVQDFVHEETTADGGMRPAFTALRTLAQALAERGVDLIVVPVPDRVHLYADKVVQEAANFPPSYLPHTKLMTALLENDILAVDVMPALMNRRLEGNPVYYRTTYAMPSYTASEIAQQVAGLLDTMGLPDAPVTYQRNVVELPISPELRATLPKDQQDTIPPETATLFQISDADGKLFAPSPTGTVLVVGEIALNDDEYGASFAAQLSYFLGFPVALPQTTVTDEAVPTYFVKNPPELNAVRALVFLFPEYALLRPGW